MSSEKPSLCCAFSTSGNIREVINLVKKYDYTEGDINEFVAAFERVSSSTDDDYWEYCGIKISNSIKCIPCTDRINSQFKNGFSTALLVDCTPDTVEEYQKKYSIKGIDGKLYWNERKTVSG